MKIALIADTHFGARGDSLLFHDYFMRFYNEVFFPYLEDNNIDTIIHLGDVTDRRKFINYNILDGLKSGFIEKMKKYDTYFIIGNHDVYYKNTNRINSMDQLFGDDFKTYTEATTLNIGGTDICFVPWINAENHDKTVKHLKKTKAKVALGHLELNGFEMMRGIKCEAGMDVKLFNKFDLTCSGHFHTKSSQGSIHYLGAPYEMFWNDCNDTKGFHILDTDDNELEFITNPFQMFHKIYYNDSNDAIVLYPDDLKGKYIKLIVVNKNDQLRFDIYVDELYKMGVADLSIVDDTDFEFEESTDIDTTEDTMSLLTNYIDNYEIDVDKNKLKQIMQELYVSALRGE
jgi:DNA repair exonuclease SbcCD nuclease subunit